MSVDEDIKVNLNQEIEHRKQIGDLTKIMLDYGRSMCDINSAIADQQFVEQFVIVFRGYAERIFDAGYRRISKNEVVMTKDEKIRLLKEMYEQGRFDAIADLDKEGKVVISKKKYDNFKLEIQEAHNKGVRAGFDMTKFKECSIRKETAREYHDKMQKVIHERDYVEGYAEIGLQEENDEIAKQLGVEVEE